jgi:ATP-dependent RNA helicase DDX46/PRP5
MEKQKITTPFQVQAQCLPCIMAGRDTIGIAKNGSGKTLAYLLPLLRHIMDHPPLETNESGPIGLVLAPARELAYQIHMVCKVFTIPAAASKLGTRACVNIRGAKVFSSKANRIRSTVIFCNVCDAYPSAVLPAKSSGGP